MNKYRLFNNTFYKTKKDCLKAWRSIIQKTPANEWGKPLDETTNIKYSDIQFLIDNYFESWPNYMVDNFHSRPIVSFCISPNGFTDSKGNKIFHLEGTNDEGFTDAITQQNFSCFGTGYRLNLKKILGSAFRGAIIKQIMSFKYSSGNKICNICKQPIKPQDSDVDHVRPTICQLINNFKQEKNYTDEYLISLIINGAKLPKDFLDTMDNNTNNLAHYWYYFYKDEQKVHKEFADYHKEHAVLQSVCRPCHKEKTKKDLSHE